MPASPHLNQPGGPFRASTHPRVAGRERELRSLADAVRRLVALTVDSDADAASTAYAAARLHALADELEPALVPVADPPKHAAGVGPEGEDPHPHDNFQFDAVLGMYNPLALPVEMTWEPPVARGRACFTTAYEGPPGCVHGAMIAAAFDQVFNVANLRSGVAGPTAYLHIDYRRPTLLRRELVFEGWVDRVEGRKVVCRGRIVQGEAITCEAEGLFVQLPRDEISRFSER
jgi:acyl-coenzyme A thioesterase PaaI-like protein